MAGGTLGVGFAFACLPLLVAFSPGNLPRLDQISIDGRVLLFALAISVLAGALFGLIPVRRYARPPLAGGLRESGRTLSQGRERHRLRSALVVAQVALALVLLISSGLMIRTFQVMNHVDPGFTQPGEILTMGIGIPEGLVKDGAEVARTDQEIARKLAAIAGVEAVGISCSMTTFLRHGLLLTRTGVIFGLAAANALTRLMVSLLFEVSPIDPVTYGAVAAALLVAALAASCLPARKVTAVDPVEALRAE